jgi:hypothetical protein
MTTMTVKHDQGVVPLHEIDHRLEDLAPALNVLSVTSPPRRNAIKSSISVSVRFG